jgi:microcystin-dependent protein
MGQPYIGEIRLFAGTFNPAGWEFCNGQMMPIAENEALFQLIGTTYGGDGQETFALPNLQSRVPLHFGTGPDNLSYPIAQMAGVESVTLSTQQIPSHTHPFMGSLNSATSSAPAGNVPSVTQASTITPYGTDNPLTTFPGQSVTPQGGSQPHENCQPFLCINYIISMFGIFPSQT